MAVGFLFEYAFGISHNYGVIIGAAIIAIYTSMGGVKSVTLTDVIQLFTFGTIIPTLLFFVFKNLDNVEMISQTIKHSEMFNYKEVFDFIPILITKYPNMMLCIYFLRSLWIAR